MVILVRYTKSVGRSDSNIILFVRVWFYSDSTRHGSGCKDKMTVYEDASFGSLQQDPTEPLHSKRESRANSSPRTLDEMNTMKITIWWYVGIKMNDIMENFGFFKCIIITFWMRRPRLFWRWSTIIVRSRRWTDMDSQSSTTQPNVEKMK